jgi:hypothetical protein
MADYDIPQDAVIRVITRWRMVCVCEGRWERCKFAESICPIWFSFDSSYKVDYIKQRVFEELDIRPDRQVLFYGSQRLRSGDRTFLKEDYKIEQSELRLQVVSSAPKFSAPKPSGKCIIL